MENLLDEVKYRWAKTHYLISPAGKESGRRIVLVNGGPRTGTTWTVGMIASVPGYRQVGNFKHNIEQYQSVLPGDVIHGHNHYSKHLETILYSLDIRVVLPLRDPRDQTVSRLFHTRRNTEHSWRIHLQKLSDDDGLMACIEGLDPKTFPGAASLASIPRSWLANYPKTNPIKYEDLISNPESSMASLFRRLEMTVPQGLLLAIINIKSFQHMTVGKKIWQKGRAPGSEDRNAHIRKGIVGDWKNYFKPHHIERFKELAGNVLIEFGYEKDLYW